MPRTDEGFAWMEELPQHRPRKIPLWSPKPGRPVKVVILSDRLELVEVHHTGRGSFPCREDRTKCRLCVKGNVDLRVKGYVAAWSREEGREVLAEITDEAMQRCKALTARAGLRGRLLTLTRLGAAANSRVAAHLDPVAVETPLPSPCDVRLTLARIWAGKFKPGSGEGITNGEA